MKTLETLVLHQQHTNTTLNSLFFISLEAVLELYDNIYTTLRSVR